MRRFVTAAILLCAAAGAVVAQGGTGEKKTFEVTTKSFEFVPNKIEVNQGDTVVITTKSADRTHGFAIKKFNVKQSVPKGGTPVTVEALDQVGAAEAMLRAIGLRQVRVRHHGDVARIETDADGMLLAFVPENRERIVDRLRNLGYKHVALDLAGYRQGSMNAVSGAADRSSGQ